MLIRALSRHAFHILALSLLLLPLIHARSALEESPESSCGVPPKGLTSEEQCAYIRERCSEPFSGFLNYMVGYYCSPFRLGALFFLLLWLAMIFMTLATAASHFLAVNLSNISAWLRLSETIAGVTLAAFGNGAPDLFTTFSAMNANIAGLALGELIGAASFITMVVVGIVAVISPFKLPRRPFLRDLGFFMGALITLLVVTVDGVITLGESIFMVSYYVVYVGVVVGGHYIYRAQRERQKRKVEAAIEVIAETMDETEGEDADESTGLLNAPTLSPRLAVESRYSPEPFLPTDNDDPTDPNANEDLYDAGHLVGRDLVRLTTEKRRSQMSNIFRSPDSASARSVPLVWTEDPDEDVLALTDDLGSTTHPHPSHTQNRLNFIREEHVSTALVLLHCLFPILHEWAELPTLDRAYGVLTAPAYALLRMTTPVVGREDVKADQIAKVNSEFSFSAREMRVNPPEEAGAEGERVVSIGGDDLDVDVEEKGRHGGLRKYLSRELVVLQCFASPIFTCFAVSGLQSVDKPAKVPLWAISLIIGVGLALVAAKATHRIPVYRFGIILSAMGFFMSVVWIFMVAGELVNLLQSLGLIMGLSETLVGLTILAVGNSMGDLLTNISIAKLGFPAMAVGACFGSPMLNLVLGIGLTSLYLILSRGETYALAPSTTIYVSSIGLLIVLGLSAVLVPLDDFRASRKFGITLLVAYAVLMCVNIVVELASAEA
ncbi:Sodium/calcium exchanger protein-domain-containing protein [Cladochytrium replicatum]|nr:Sodium/calcium exchanger protein-domain-containing protein [Cladochytrium replicatum]